jgi:polyphosphate kinase
VVDPVHPFPFLSNLSLSLAVEMRNPETDLIRFARVKIPEILPRFVRIETLESQNEGLANDSTGTTLVALEDLIRDNLADLFPGMEILNCYPFRVTRDMDLEILEEEAGDLLAMINRELQRRKFGDVVRLELPPDVPARIQSLLADKLELDEDDVFEFAGQQVGKGVFAAGVLNPLMDIIGGNGSLEAAYPPELLSIEAYTKGKLKPGDVLNAEVRLVLRRSCR